MRAPSAHADDIAGLVDIGDGRSLFLNCQGDGGTPTVFVIPGKGSYADAWNAAVPPDDPIRSSPYDVIEQAKVAPTSRLGAAARRADDADLRLRPAEHPAGRHRPVDAGHPAAHRAVRTSTTSVSLIAAAELPTPMVFVAHSYGGLVLDLLARQHPDLVSGLVFTEPTSEFLRSVGRPDQNAAFNADGQTVAPGEEAILADDAFAAIAAAPPLPRVPAIVLSADKFADPADAASRTTTPRPRSTRRTTCWPPRSAPSNVDRPGHRTQPDALPTAGHR